MTIGLDFDGVIINWSSLKKDTLMQWYGHDLPEHQISKEQCVRDYIMSSREYDDYIQRIWTDSSTIGTMREVSGACEGITKLLYHHDLSIVTARPPESEHIIRAWTSRHEITLPIIHADKKNTTAWAVPFACIVDDDYRILKRIAGQTKQPLLMSAWYNEHETVELPCARVANWQELLALLDKN